ncbi:MAG: hypothetical protein JJE10_01685 [Thermoleophilia bacterium]|nr:hypothetical protein [Thermoleophilia bacterium]
MNPAQQSPQIPGGSPREMRFLNIIAVVAVIDVLLLIPLIWASRWVADRHDLVAVLGPVHGFLFLVLIGLCAYGSLQKWWGWWFPILVVVTLGPLGSLIGDWIVRRQLKHEARAATGSPAA